MCGIFALIEQNKVNIQPEKADEIFKSYKSIISSVYSEFDHRVPDSKGNNLIIDPNFKKTVLMLHSRLKICGDNTTQPLINDDNTILSHFVSYILFSPSYSLSNHIYGLE